MRIFWANIHVTDEGILYTRSTAEDVQGDLSAFGKFQELINNKRVTPNEHIEGLPGRISRITYAPGGNIGSVGFIGGSCVIAMIDYRDVGLFIHELDALAGTCRSVFEEVVAILQRETGGIVLSVHQSQSKHGALTYHLALPKLFPAHAKKHHNRRTHYVCCF
jgi:hypothetical protein